MRIDRLYLELTRNCTLECEHCLRGNKEKKDMDVLTLENSLKDIEVINTLLLTGGEPLLNIEILKALPRIIEKYNIQVNNISIITNGTVESIEHIRALKKISESCNSFDLVLSSDLFHRLEWNRLKLNDVVENNFKIYQQFFSMRKFLDNDSFHSIVLLSSGRAKSLSEDRLKELEKKYYIKYKFSSEAEEYLIQRNGDNIYGKLYINVYGNVTPYNVSFSDEDDCYNSNQNVNDKSLIEILDEINNQELCSYTRQRIRNVSNQ